MTRRLVVCSLEAWDEVWRRNQYLVSGLLQQLPDLDVLFVEPPHDLVHGLRRGQGVSLGRGLGHVHDMAGGRLHTLQATKVLPRAAGPAADMLLRHAVLRATAALGWDTATLWINDPGWAGLAAVTGWPTLYDVTDDWLQADRPEREHRRLVANEALLMERAAAVTVCSPALLASKGAMRPVELVANAVDVARYRALGPRPADLPAGPTAVYVGTLHEDRLDVDLVLETARAVGGRGGTLVLVGPNALSPQHRDRLEAEPHLRVLGPRPYSAVPAYLQHAAVLVVPHVVDAFTETLDPIKLYEYRAVGRPVVTTPVAGFREAASDLVTVASNAYFARAAGERLLAAGAAVPAEDVPDWADRVTRIEKVLAPLW